MRADRAILFKLATSERLEQLVKSLPGGDEAAYRAASRYVAGRTRAEALDRTAVLLAQGHGVSVDLFGELSTSTTDARRVADDYLELAKLLPEPPADVWLSVDLSHFALDIDPAGAADLLAEIAAGLPTGRRIQVGAEDLARTDRVLACVQDVAARGLADRLGATVQANLVRSPADADALIAAGVHIRLVKGAYVEPHDAHPYGEPTDIAYLRLAHQLAAANAPWSLATHDARLHEAVLLTTDPSPHGSSNQPAADPTDPSLRGNRPTVEHLLGVRPESLDDLRTRSVPTRVYVPYGPDWFRYWLRRVAESRGA